MIETSTGTHTTCKYHLGGEVDHTTYESELVGIMIALHLAAHTSANKTATIFSDNQSMLKIINKPPNGPAAHISLHIGEVMKALTERCAALA
jgi:ribonuclease HI